MDGLTLPHVEVVSDTFAVGQWPGLLDVVPRPDQVSDHAARECAVPLLDARGVSTRG